MIQIGFYLPDGSSYFQENELDNHVDIAFRLIQKRNWLDHFRQSGYHDPVDFLVFYCGALKLGNRYFGKTISFCPSKITPGIQEWIKFYLAEGYGIDFASHPEHVSVHDIVCLFHRN